MAAQTVTESGGEGPAASLPDSFLYQSATAASLPNMTPYYLVHEALLRRNLQLIRRIADEAGVEFILAFKAFALWKTFPVFREYIAHTTASSPDEARLALEEFGMP